MKLGVALIVIGVLILILAIPFSIIGIMAGIAEAQLGRTSGGLSAYILPAGVVIGFLLIVIGSMRVYFRK